MNDPVLAMFEDLVPGSRPRRPAAPPPPDPGDPEWSERPKPRKMPLNGVQVEFFAIGNLSRALGRKPVTIRSWEDKGVLPLSRYRTAPPKKPQVPGAQVRGRRLYTRQQIESVVAAAKATGVYTNERDADWKKFTKLVVEAWRRGA